jgi:chromosome segregation ATPase
MLSLNKLEKVIELEEQLRAEYQSQLDQKTTEIENHVKKSSELQATIETQQAKIDGQLETITNLSGKVTDNQRVEQLNRELSNRGEKLQEEVSDLKKRVKVMQKDLAEERAENKTLKQFDPARMKKNLDANKKKLAEKTRANDALQKSLSNSRAENAEQQGKIKELETKLEELEASPDTEEAAA